MANLARHLSVNPEDALRKANLKFVLRFNYIENNMKLLGKDIKDANLEEMEHFWNEARKLDKMKV